MKSVILNLYNAKDRELFINSQFNKQGIKHTFFRGLNNNLFKLKDKNIGHPNGLVGCFVSHLLAWQNAPNSIDNYCMFFEDDYILPDNFIEKVETFMKDLPESIDLAFLYWNKIGSGSSFESKPINDTWQKCKGTWSTAAYILNLKSVNKLTESLNQVHGHIDVVLANKGWDDELQIAFLKEPIGGLNFKLKSQIAMRQ